MSSEKTSIDFLLNHAHISHKDEERDKDDDIFQVSQSNPDIAFEKHGLNPTEGASENFHNRKQNQSSPDLAIETPSIKRNSNAATKLKVSSLSMDSKHRPERFKCELCNQTFTEKGKLMLHL